jgi:hypothetical protein
MTTTFLRLRLKYQNRISERKLKMTDEWQGQAGDTYARISFGLAKSELGADERPQSSAPIKSRVKQLSSGTILLGPQPESQGIIKNKSLTLPLL